MSGTSSGHKTLTATSDRYMEVTLNYTHSLFLNFQIPALPSTWPMTSTARFPVPPFYTAFVNTSSC